MASIDGAHPRRVHLVIIPKTYAVKDTANKESYRGVGAIA